jgi:ETFB lysine methyltransferase
MPWAVWNASDSAIVGEARLTGYSVDSITLRVGDRDYRIRVLSNRQQYHDPDGHAERAGISSATWPLFGMIWPAGVALAEEMATFPIAGRRILEIGCGLALSSLVLQHRGADITASDNHPLAADFLRHNAHQNGLAPLRYCNASWAVPNPELGQFDLIIGGDLLYEPDHPALLAAFIARHARSRALVLIADPGRGYRGQFSRRLAEQGYTRTAFPCRAGGAEVQTKGKILSFARGLD